MRGRSRVAVAARSARGRAAGAKLLAGIEEIDLVAEVNGGLAAEGLPYEVIVYLLEAGESPDAFDSTVPVLFVVPDQPLQSPVGGELSFVPRQCSRRELAAAISAVAAGLVVRRPGILALPSRPPLPLANRSGVATPHGDWGSPESDRLTARERQVLVMIAEGLPNKTIAAELGITSHTVKFHISSIMQKLGAASRTEAVTIGLRKGIIFL